MGFLNSISRSENLLIDTWHFGNKVAFMDLYIFKGNNFSLQENNLFIPYKNDHPRQMIKIYVTGVLKKNVRTNTEELNFLKIKNSFSLRMRNRGCSKNKLSRWLSEENILIMPIFS